MLPLSSEQIGFLINVTQNVVMTGCKGIFLKNFYLVSHEINIFKGTISLFLPQELIFMYLVLLGGFSFHVLSH